MHEQFVDINYGPAITYFANYLFYAAFKEASINPCRRA